VQIQARENIYDVRLIDGILLRSINPADPSLIAPVTEVDWRVCSEQLLYFDDSGKRL